MAPSDLELLDFAALTWRHAGSQDAAIRDRFGMTPTAYFQKLHYLIDTPEALAERPALTNRLRRLRDRRRYRGAT